MRRKLFAFVIAILLGTLTMTISMGQAASTHKSNSFSHKGAEFQTLFCAIDNDNWDVKQA